LPPDAGHHARRAQLPALGRRQHPVERTAGLERPGVLQLLQLERHRDVRDEVTGRHDGDRRPAHESGGALPGRLDVVPGDHAATVRRAAVAEWHSARVSTGDLDVLLARLAPEVADLVRAADALVHEVDPDVVRVVWPHQGTVGYGVGPAKNSEHYAYLATFARHLNLGFNHGASLDSGACSRAPARRSAS
jgi:hypothetical protein